MLKEIVPKSIGEREAESWCGCVSGVTWILCQEHQHPLCQSHQPGEDRWIAASDVVNVLMEGDVSIGNGTLGRMLHSPE